MRKIHFKVRPLWEDIMTVTLANMTLGFVILEQSRFPTIMPYVHQLFLLLTLYFWCSTAFKNGNVRRYGFLLYTALFFLSAQIFMILYQYLVSIRIYNKYVDWLNQVLKFVVIHPYKFIIDFFYHQFGFPLSVSVSILMIGYCACFYAGCSLYMVQKNRRDG